jgi:surface protein
MRFQERFLGEHALFSIVFKVYRAFGKTPKPKNRRELGALVIAAINQGETDLNFIDTSRIEDMQYLFRGSLTENLDISRWDVSNVVNMRGMFLNSKFNGELSKWDTSKVEGAHAMFKGSNFNGDLSQWDTSSVKDTAMMFDSSQFNGDIGQWDVSNVRWASYMFANSPFNRDVSKWKIRSEENVCGIFRKSVFKGDLRPWGIKRLDELFDEENFERYTSYREMVSLKEQFGGQTKQKKLAL